MVYTGREHVSFRLAKEGQHRREELLTFIEKFMAEEGWSPTREDMSKHLGVSARAVEKHLAILRDEGKIELGARRGVRIAR